MTVMTLPALLDATELDALPRPAYAVEPGRQYPLGATVDDHGVNFAIFAPDATAVELLLFASHDDRSPIATVRLDPEVNRTFHFWHVYLRGLGDRAHYAYRVHGEDDPATGRRFDPEKVLIDPYSRANSKTLWNRGDACRPGDNLGSSIRSVVVDPRDFDWAGDRPLRKPMRDTVIYEMHVGGFTRSPTSGVKNPGTFSAVVEKIPYLKELGVTAVELLPVFEFDDTESRIVDGRRLTNYWGYSTMAYFAPHPGYCVKPEIGDHVNEFREMVKALHAADIEVILDVVFNHTDEGNHQGPMYSFKGFANSAYYYLVPEDKRFYYDYTGCGNTFNTNHPIGEKFILDCLRYWVEEMHVDGFRFDEASVLSRGEDGAPLPHPPVLWQIELDEVLVDTKVIAEAWDAAGLYQVGHFPGARWAEWNGRFRDDVRRFVRGDAGAEGGRSLVGSVAARMTGSADLYAWNNRLPVNSVNFVACHDGFTLNDLVSYDGKHNEANGEGNRDGVDDNMSWNCGVEGPAGPDVEALRDRQVKNFAAILMLSQGVPMILMGDEVRRSQGGNNNGWCQDTDISWFDWSKVSANDHIFRFFKEMIAFRKRHPAIHRSRYLQGSAGPVNARGLADITWHGTRVGAPDWSADSRVLAFTLAGPDDGSDLHVILNMYWEPLDFELPSVAGHGWCRAVDTALAAPQDIAAPGAEVSHPAATYRVEGRSVVVLVNRPI
ncbi:glycogen debranching protein GlgX [Mongoliimonas terrestris]|uniref:glycogen debranching protein GlgX n=1 Tax=Mongoliimonas terrestris TaxID=1709001 RepID=UPI0009F916D8|nr:glycogen debranching protein GlgX [Mongoliimonas terrestris]